VCIPIVTRCYKISSKHAGKQLRQVEASIRGGKNLVKPGKYLVCAWKKKKEREREKRKEKKRKEKNRRERERERGKKEGNEHRLAGISVYGIRAQLRDCKAAKYPSTGFPLPGAALCFALGTASPPVVQFLHPALPDRVGVITAHVCEREHRRIFRYHVRK